jgi:hypothetical protein
MMQIFDLPSERVTSPAACAKAFDPTLRQVVNSIKTSNSIYQLHGISSFCVLLEAMPMDQFLSAHANTPVGCPSRSAVRVS